VEALLHGGERDAPGRYNPPRQQLEGHMAKTDVTTAAQADLPAIYAGMEEYAGAGINELDSSDKSIPFLKIIEKGSPEMEEGIGAQPGMLINTATKKLYDSVRFVPACREHAYVEWVPVDNGGGLVASYPSTAPISVWAKAQRGKVKLKNGNDLVETFYLFGTIDDGDGDVTPAVIAFTSTRIATYKTITNKASALMLPGSNGRKFNPPWFAHAWRIGTKKETDDKKRTWFTFTADFDSPDKAAAGAILPADHPAFQMGVLLVQQKAEGTLKMADDNGGRGPEPDTGTSGGYSGGQGGSGSADDDDPPF
jgi:hypothetical protein